MGVYKNLYAAEGSGRGYNKHMPFAPLLQAQNQPLHTHSLAHGPPPPEEAVPLPLPGASEGSKRQA